MTTTDSSLRIGTPPQTLREIATDKVRAAILSGHFKSGERLVERVLCDQLGVSRTVVRELIRYLEAEGLVEFVPHRGPIVARLDWPQARQIYKVRRLLEMDAVRDCAALAGAADRDRIAAALARLEHAYAAEDGHELAEASIGFYREIFATAGHDISWEIVNRLNGRISRLRTMTLATADRHSSGFSRMRDIFRAIEQGDAEAAAAAVGAHIDEASEIARRQLE